MPFHPTFVTLNCPTFVVRVSIDITCLGNQYGWLGQKSRCLPCQRQYGGTTAFCLSLCGGFGQIFSTPKHKIQLGSTPKLQNQMSLPTDEEICWTDLLEVPDSSSYDESLGMTGGNKRERNWLAERRRLLSHRKKKTVNALNAIGRSTAYLPWRRKRRRSLCTTSQSGRSSAPRKG
jgi:hypothetical protein